MPINIKPKGKAVVFGLHWTIERSSTIDFKSKSNIIVFGPSELGGQGDSYLYSI